MNAKTTQTPKSPANRRPLLGALLALSVVAAAWPGVSRADDRTERPVPRQLAMSGSAAPASLHGLVAQQAEARAYAVVRRNVSALQTCYLRHGNAGGGGGKLEVSFDVGPSGRATDIRVNAPDLQRTGIPACVSAAVARWPFPASVRARVSFPLLFVQG